MSKSLKFFKNIKAKVKNQFDKRIKKKVRSNHGDEYYGRYDSSSEQCIGPFAKFREKYSTIL